MDGARLNDDTQNPEYNVPQVLEFRATFANAPSQSVGLGGTFEAPPYATFTTGGPAGLAHADAEVQRAVYRPTRTSRPSGPQRRTSSALSGRASELKYFVDDQQIETHNVRDR